MWQNKNQIIDYLIIETLILYYKLFILKISVVRQRHINASVS